MKNKYDLVLFDLDGTLTDPGAGLMKSFYYALEKMGVNYGSYDSLRRFIGPPLYDTWIAEFGFSNEECDLALDHFHDYFGERGWNDNIPYEGILPMLARVKESGVIVALATSKPMVYAKPICDLFGITPYIDFLGAADTDKTRDKKWEVIEYVLEHYPEISRERTVIVGDRHFDADGAHTTGIHAVGVTYGYGSLEEVEGAGFDTIVHRVEDIPEALLED